MAKTPANKQTPAPEAESWNWSDDFDTGIAPPSTPAPRATALPFKGLFDKMLAPALRGEKPSKAVPLAFFTARSTNPATFTPGKAQSKVRDQFNAWLEDQPKETQEALTIAFSKKTGEESDARMKEAHLVFWVLSTTPAPAA